MGATLDYLDIAFFLRLVEAAQCATYRAFDFSQLWISARTAAFRGDEQRSSARTMVLWLGIAFNVAFLGYFKYSDFARVTINDVFGANLVLTHIILPLGISFITFQKIAFLIDVHAGRVKSFTFQRTIACSYYFSPSSSRAQ